MARPSLILQVLLALLVASGQSFAADVPPFGKSLRQLTFHPEIDYYPSWSPDGRSIVFSSNREGQALWIVPVEGGPPVRLTEIESNHPSWSPDGAYIAFDGDQGTVLRIVPATGGVPVRIVPESLPLNRGAHPCWSPDGASVVFSAQGDIWTVNLPTGRLERIFHRDGCHARAFSWSPDGRFLTADVGSEGKRDDDVWLIPAAGGEPVVLTDFPGRDGNPLFSPDGTMIAYMHDEEGRKELRIMTADGGKWIRITEYEGFNANPRWSPDGTMIAFSSDRGGSPDIFVMELDLVRIRAALGLEAGGK